MEIRFTTHALNRMELREITREEVEVLLTGTVLAVGGATAVEYDGEVQGRRLHAVVVRGSDPPLVITVWASEA